MITSSRLNFRIPFLLILGSFLAAYLCFWLLPSVFEIWNSQVIDQLFVFRSSSETLRPPLAHTVAQVDLNNTSIKRLENFYINRSHFAQMTRNLALMKVSAQVYDFIFAGRLDEKYDRSLINATEDAGDVYYGLAFELLQEEQLRARKEKTADAVSYLENTKWHLKVEGDISGFYTGMNPLTTFSELASASAGLGSLSIKCDRDGVLRRVPLIVRYEGAFYPILPFRVICNYLHVPPERILVKPGKSITLRNAQSSSEKGPHDIVIPIDWLGNMIVNYIGPWGQMDHYAFADILLASNDRVELEMWREELKGKIVLISDVSTGSSDMGPVPTDANFPLSGVHANIMNGILTESFLKELSNGEMLIIEVLLLAIVLFLSVRFSALYFSMSAFLLTGLYLATVSMGFFYGNIIFHVARPLLMILFASVSVVVWRYIHEEKEKMESLRQRDFIRETFGRYLSNEVVEELLGAPEGLKMSGESREVTFLVSDLRGFTALTSRLSPMEIINILNRYLETMFEVIAQYRGTISEIEGDGILAFFGAPLKTEDDSERAVACAIDMQKALAVFNEEQRKLDLPELAMGIGLDRGEVVVGNIGSEKRAKYSAIGSPINTTYRIESCTVGGQILISPGIYEKVKSLVQIRDTSEIKFKGIDHPMTLYDVAGISGEYKISVPQKRNDLFLKIEPPLIITCFPLEGKVVSNRAVPGHMTHLGKSGADLFIQGKLNEGLNLKIEVLLGEARSLSEIYAKVICSDPHEPGATLTRARVEFTWLPDDMKTFFVKRLRESSVSHED